MSNGNNHMTEDQKPMQLLLTDIASVNGICRESENSGLLPKKGNQEFCTSMESLHVGKNSTCMKSTASFNKTNLPHHIVYYS